MCSIESGATLPRCGHDSVLTAFESSRIDRVKYNVWGRRGLDLDALIRLRSMCPGLNPRYLYIVIHGDMRHNCYRVVSLSEYLFRLFNPLLLSPSMHPLS